MQHVGLGRLSAATVRALDITEAGDTFWGVLAAHRAKGHAVPGVLATAVSAIRMGAYAALPTSDELRGLG